MATFSVMNVVTTPAPAPVEPVTNIAVATKMSGVAASGQPSWRVVALSVGGFVVATIGAWFVFKLQDTPSYFKVGSDYTALAALVLAAGAIERFLEPFSQWLVPKKDAEEAAATAKTDAAKDAADPGKDAASVQEKVTSAAADAAKLDKKRGERAIVFWAIASSAALVAPVGLGLFFIRAVAATGIQPNRYVDMVFTALVIGAGTKPLHDTIDRMQKKKQAAEDVDASAGAGTP